MIFLKLFVLFSSLISRLMDEFINPAVMLQSLMIAETVNFSPERQTGIITGDGYIQKCCCASTTIKIISHLILHFPLISEHSVTVTDHVFD